MTDKEQETPAPGAAKARSGWAGFGGLVLAGWWLFFHGLATPGLIDPDEGRYAEIGREMLLLKDWLVPHLNLLPYLEKPPLVYWLTALSFSAQGMNEWAARLPSALSGLGGVLLAFWLGRELWGRAAGWLGAMVLATCAGYVVMARLLTLDMTLSFFLNLGVGLGYLALSRERPELWPWAYLALALGVLTKGPVALVLAGGIWGVWAWLQKRPALGSWLQPGGLALLTAICLPWFVLVAWRYPDFLRFFVVEQHLGRFLTASIHHNQPMYYYLPVLLGFMLPWSWLLPWAIFREKPWADPDRLFLLVWAGVVLAFFSLSRGKLAPYILPALLPLALLLGKSLAGVSGSGRRLTGSPGLMISLVVWAFLAWGLVSLYLHPPGFLVPLLDKAEPLWPVVPLMLLVLALTTTFALLCRRTGALLAGALLVCTLVPWGMERVSLERSPREMGALLQARWRPGAALVGYRLYSQGLTFYSGQVFHLLSFPTELDYGRGLEKTGSLFFDTPGEVAAYAGKRPLTFFFLRAEDLAFLEEELPGRFTFLGRWKNSILVSYETDSLQARQTGAEKGSPARPAFSPGG